MQRCLASKNLYTIVCILWCVQDWVSPYQVATAGDLDEFGEEDHYNLSKVLYS